MVIAATGSVWTANKGRVPADGESTTGRFHEQAVTGLLRSTFEITGEFFGSILSAFNAFLHSIIMETRMLAFPGGCGGPPPLAKKYTIT
jgi:hypothetical protein